MGEDTLGVKADGSAFLTFKVELTQRELGINTAGEEGYQTVSPESMAKMWANKYRHILPMYGLGFEIVTGASGNSLIK